MKIHVHEPSYETGRHIGSMSVHIFEIYMYMNHNMRQAGILVSTTVHIFEY